MWGMKEQKVPLWKQQVSKKWNLIRGISKEAMFHLRTASTFGKIRWNSTFRKNCNNLCSKGSITTILITRWDIFWFGRWKWFIIDKTIGTVSNISWLYNLVMLAWSKFYMLSLETTQVLMCWLSKHLKCFISMIVQKFLELIQHVKYFVQICPELTFLC